MKNRHLFFAGALLLALTFLAMPLAALEAPAMNGPVNDLAGVMSAQEVSDLTAYLSAVNDQTGVQVAVLTVKSLEGDAVEAFSMRVAEKWKLGQADKDNGALLVVSVDDRSLRIEAGYGLEGTLTDMKSGLIIRNVIVPFFKEGKYGAGIIAGAQNIVGVATDNASIVSEAVRNPDRSSAKGSGGAGLFFILIFILIMIFGRGGRSGRGGGLLWGMLLGSLLSGSNRSGGSSGFGGGGGFSGGGGGFGGGGASGGW